jgi:RHS repeat-associated protein
MVHAIPIASSPGRGINLNFSVVYNSLNWAPGGGAWNPAYTTNPNALWGWQLNFNGGQPTYTTTTSQGSCGHIQGETGTTYITKYNQFKYIDLYGTAHPFNVWWQDVYSTCTGLDTYTGTFTGYATDGSGYYISIDRTTGSINSVLSSGGLNVTNPGTIIDTNGNYMSSSNVGGGETDWTDSAGRVALKVITGTSSIQYEYLDPTGAYRTTTLNLQSLPVKTNFGCSGVIEYTGTASVPYTLVLPNQQTYTFTYEPTPGNSSYSTGRLQRVKLPTNGYYEYDYTGSNDGINCADGTILTMNRVVNDGTNTATWNYVRNTTNLTTTITTPHLADTPNANDMVVTFNSAGQEISRKIYANSPGTGTPLRAISTTWAANGTPATRVTILEDGSTQSEMDTTYDSNGLLDSVSEYNWGSGSRGTLFRTTNYTYQTSTNYTNLDILNLVISKQIKDGGGTIQYRQDTTYDGVALLSANCPTGASQHYDTAYPCTFNYRGNPTQITTYLAPATQGNGISKNFTYDWFGNLRTAQVNCCQNKTWGYSSASATQNYSLPDSVTSGSSPSLKTTYAYYLPTGQVNTATDPNGLITTFSYDYLRRLTQASQNSGATALLSYNDTAFTATTTASIDSSKSVKQISSLDTLGRPYLTTTEDASNNIYSKVSTNYDLAGRAYKTSNPYTGASPSYWTVTQFDVLGRPTSMTLPDNSATTSSYSTNTTTVTDPAGVQRKSTVDGNGRLSAITEPDPTNNNSLSLLTSYTYNVLDELTQITQGSQTRTYLYDALGRLFTATTPEAGTVCFGTVSAGSCQSNTGYDSFDNLLYRTDARGVLTSHGYDSLNRLTSVSYTTTGTTAAATSSLGFTYGNDSSCNSAHGAGCIGQRITMTDGVGSENYTYNNIEQLTQLQKVINGSTYNTSYAYNLASELTQITYPSGRVVQQSVDPIGRLCEIAPSTIGCGTATSPYATGYGYGTAGQVTGFKYGNGLYASFGFSADRLQLNCLDYSTTDRSGSCTHDGTTRFGLNYSYPSSPGNNGLFSGISDSVDSGRSAAYTYDSLYRLVTASTTGSTNYPAWGLQGAYDRYGNRNTQSVLSGCTGITCPTFSSTASASTNRLPSPYTYDASGNMTYDGLNTLVYDGESHAVSATNSTTAGAYVSDGNGLRVQKCIPNCTSPTTRTVYLFSGSKVIAEYDNGAAVGSPSREYIYAGGALLAKIDSSGTKYYHQDHLSNRLVTDSTGNTLAQMGHFPNGESWYNASSDKLLFTTYERDSESGNDYAQARYNVSRLARFSSPDPISGSTSDPQSLNRYSYVRNMPVMLTDPTGLMIGCTTADDHAPSQDKQQDSKTGGGPFASGTDSDSAEPEPQSGCGYASRLPGGAGGGGGDGYFIDGSYMPWDLGGGFTSAAFFGGTVQCPNNNCYGVQTTTVTSNATGQVLLTINQITEFSAFADGGQGYFPNSGLGALYGSAGQAGQAAGAFFFADTEATHREFGGRLTEDAEGFFSYDLKSVGAVCPPGADCFSGFMPSSDDVAIWHTHVYDQDIVQFLGDRSPMVATPTDYVTTPMGPGMGTFQVGAWPGGGILAGGTYGPLPAQIEMVGPPHVAPICQLSGPKFPGISPCN